MALESSRLLLALPVPVLLLLPPPAVPLISQYVYGDFITISPADYNFKPNLKFKQTH